MNPTSNETNGIQLPPPVAEQAPASAGEAGPPPAQAPVSPAEAGSAAQAAAAAPPVIPAPIMPTIPPAPQTDASSTTVSSTSLPADDGDLIEKEWVMRAKAIVERTRDDPHKQSEELTVVKADYMKQRYNKSIKLSK